MPAASVAAFFVWSKWREIGANPPHQAPEHFGLILGQPRECLLLDLKA